MINITADIINGVSAGIEYVAPDENIDNSTIIIDIIFFRFIIEW